MGSVKCGFDIGRRRRYLHLVDDCTVPSSALLFEIEEVLAEQGRSERLRDGLVVAIAGTPNVGKSTLMNQLARRDVQTRVSSIETSSPAKYSMVCLLL